MKTITVLLLCVLGTLCGTAQTTEYESMKAQMTEKSIPLVNITVDVDKLNSSTYINGTIEISDMQKRTEGQQTAIYDCTLRYRGASSLAYDKKSLNLKLTDENGADLDVSLFGIRAENSWILDAMTIDRSRMRNRVCFDVWNEMSKTPYTTRYNQRNGTDGLHVELFINGNYHGLYCINDKVDRKLLGLKKAKAETAGYTTRGILYKCSNWNSAAMLTEYANADVNSAEWNAWELQYPNDYANADTWNPLMQLIDFCGAATTDDAFVKSFDTYFYMDNVVDYFTFVNALNVRDTGYKNTFLSIPNITEGHRFLISVWDMDTSFGSDWDGSYIEETSSLDRFDYTAPFNRLRAGNLMSFNDLCLAEWQKYYQTLFLPENINARFDAYAQQLTESGAWQREVEKWNNNPVELQPSIADEMQYIKTWYASNYNSLCQQWNTATGISEATTDSGKHDVYDLQGRRIRTGVDSSYSLNGLKAGVYILNGKKITVK